MNQLSWILYLTDIAQSVGVISVIFDLLFLIIFVLLSCMYLFNSDQVRARRIEKLKLRSAPPEDYKRYDDEFELDWFRIHKFHLWLSGVLLISCVIVSCLIPSKETMYAIAASQAGEQVYKSPLGQKAEKALEAWLDKQIAPSSESK